MSHQKYGVPLHDFLLKFTSVFLQKYFFLKNMAYPCTIFRYFSRLLFFFLQKRVKLCICLFFPETVKISTTTSSPREVYYPSHRNKSGMIFFRFDRFYFTFSEWPPNGFQNESIGSTNFFKQDSVSKRLKNAPDSNTFAIESSIISSMRMTANLGTFCLTIHDLISLLD